MSKHFTISEFYCLGCGKMGVPIARKESRQRVGDHLKKIYCINCKREVNHLEKRPFDNVSDEQFKKKLGILMKIEEVHTMMKQEKMLYVMVGCPGSGKSYFSKKAVERNPSLKIVSRDRIRFELLEQDDEYFDKEVEVFNEYVSQIQNCINKGQSVIADATHLSEASRSKLLRNLDLKDFSTAAVVINTSLDSCLKRNANRVGRMHVPENVIRSMSQSKTSPSSDEKFDYILDIDGEQE